MAMEDYREDNDDRYQNGKDENFRGYEDKRVQENINRKLDRVKLVISNDKSNRKFHIKVV